jgi:hypothetical protein
MERKEPQMQSNEWTQSQEILETATVDSHFLQIIKVVNTSPDGVAHEEFLLDIDHDIYSSGDRPFVTILFDNFVRRGHI